MAFTKGTEQEVGFVVDALGLEPGERILDVGCGPGRHALALARRGFDVVGVDLSPDFIDLPRRAAAAEGLAARFEVLDVRDSAFDGEFDAAICLCQGGFGLLGGLDEVEVFGRIVAAVRPGGRLASGVPRAASPCATWRRASRSTRRPGVMHEVATVRNETGEERAFDLWTTCFTARELTLLAAQQRVEVDGVTASLRVVPRIAADARRSRAVAGGASPRDTWR